VTDSSAAAADDQDHAIAAGGSLTGRPMTLPTAWDVASGSVVKRQVQTRAVAASAGCEHY
jgi:hypothetical protein